MIYLENWPLLSVPLSTTCLSCPPLYKAHKLSLAKISRKQTSLESVVVKEKDPMMRQQKTPRLLGKYNYISKKIPRVPWEPHNSTQLHQKKDAEHKHPVSYSELWICHSQPISIAQNRSTGYIYIIYLIIKLNMMHVLAFGPWKSCLT